MFTVKDVAEFIRRPDESHEVACHRIRNLVKEGLIEPAGERHPGSGVARKFDLEAVKRAMILEAFMRSGVAATYAAKLMANCPDLTNGRTTIRLAAGVTMTIDGRQICERLSVRVAA